MNKTIYQQTPFTDSARALIEACAYFAAQGWTPATSSNFSVRMDSEHIAITVSGKDKGRLTEADIMVVDRKGKAVQTDLRPSAETLLHTQIYDQFSDVNCVLHTHSPTQTISSRLYEPQKQIRLEGYELLKAFSGNATHEMAVNLPVFSNSQDMHELAKRVAPHLTAGPIWGYLIAGHGLYAWGKNIAEARRHIEAFEFLLHCELELRRLQS